MNDVILGKKYEENANMQKKNVGIHKMLLKN